jgi:hypothetical protein
MMEWVPGHELVACTPGIVHRLSVSFHCDFARHLGAQTHGSQIIDVQGHSDAPPPELP